MASKAALLQEFDSIIGPQKAQLCSRLPHLFQQFYAAPQALAQQPGRVVAGVAPAAAPSLSKQGSAVKRGLHGVGGPDSKRVKVENDKRVDELFKELAQIIHRKLWGKKECMYFKEPVDVIKLKIPDYHTYIKTPMDLGTVKQKLTKREYSTPLEVCEDIRLIWRNCATYNQPGNVVRIFGDTMADTWERAWAESRMEERWNELMYQKDPSVSSACAAVQCGGVQGVLVCIRMRAVCVCARARLCVHVVMHVCAYAHTRAYVCACGWVLCVDGARRVLDDA